MPAPIRPQLQTASLVSTAWLRQRPRPIRVPVANLPITHLFHMHFSPLWRPRARRRRGPAGGRGICLARLDGEIAGIVPCYLKSHSQGEYVFDRGWADAYERAGGRYYPKLQVSVPFTPATGPRLLIRDGVDTDEIGTALGARTGRAMRRNQGLFGSRHLRTRGGVEISRQARLLAADRPAVSLAQPGFCRFRRFPRHPQFAASQGDQARAARRGGKRHHHPRAHRPATSPRMPGTRSSISTWRPVRANGAGPT